MSEVNEKFAGMTATASGYGKINDGKTEQITVLQPVSVSEISAMTLVYPQAARTDQY